MPEWILDRCIGKTWCAHRPSWKTMNGTWTPLTTHSFSVSVLNRWAAILAFDVQIERDAQEQATNLGRSLRISSSTELNLALSLMQACESIRMMMSINSYKNSSVITKRERKKSKSGNDIWPCFRANCRSFRIASSGLAIRSSLEYVWYKVSSKWALRSVFHQKR